MTSHISVQVVVLATVNMFQLTQAYTAIVRLYFLGRPHYSVLLLIIMSHNKNHTLYIMYVILCKEHVPRSPGSLHVFLHMLKCCTVEPGNEAGVHTLTIVNIHLGFSVG